MTDVAVLEKPVASAVWHEQPILWTRRWTDRLFSFAIERPESFRFRSGEFVMIGLPAEQPGGKPTVRAYSIASPAWAEELEFFSIQVPDGPLTSRLGLLEAGDRVLLGKKSTGTLVLDALTGGARLYLIASGTGLAPWLAVLRDPETWERFDEVIVTHTVREAGDLAYRQFLIQNIYDDPLVGDLARGRLVYYPTVTREPFVRTGRITDRIDSGAFFADLGLGRGFDPSVDRAMLCGSTPMIRDVAARLESAGLTEGSNAAPAQFVLERAFVG
ncbi:ferredoxin--NADP reductase [Brevundimonas sp.]|uniref:ferredoxin--NADP reductase n=1 Tax=Brevundimonas sp. TaxID=1871086 RepID=UPI003D10B57A